MTTFTLPTADDTIRPKMEWSEESLCRNLSLAESKKIFFPTQGRPRLYPPYKAFCNNCPVMLECLAYAVAHDFPGVWGGTTYMERKEGTVKAERSELKKRAIREGWYEPFGESDDEVPQREQEEETLELKSLLPLPLVSEAFRTDLLPSFSL